MRKIIFIAVAVIATMQVMATTRFVNLVAAGTGDGSSWANVSGDLQGMIDSSAYGDTIWVQGGKYLPTTDITGNASPTDARTKTFFLKSGVKIYGGFVGNEVSFADRTLRNIITTETNLSGDLGVGEDTTDNSYHVVFAAYCDSTTVLDGFIISDGNANGNGFQFVQSTSISYAWGGGMMVAYSPMTIRNCIFSYNYTASLGGGLFSTRSSLTISDCVFDHNSSFDQGGGWDNEFVSTSNISNSIFYGNNATTGGGILSEIGAILNVTNCTFNHNDASSAGGGLSADSSTLVNCIVWGNSPVPNITRASHSIIEGPTVFAGVGNTNEDPRFLGDLVPAGSDGIWRTVDDGLKVLSCSPAVDMGTATGAPLLDINGINRYDVPGVGISPVDMGTYENLETAPIASFTISGDTLTADSFGVTYQWLACPAETAAPGNSFSQMYIASVSGTYQLAIASGLCVDTSACTQVGPSGIALLNGAGSGLMVYPNPANSEIRIESSSSSEGIITIYDISGRALGEFKYVRDGVVDISDVAPGIYFIKTGDNVSKLTVAR